MSHILGQKDVKTREHHKAFHFL